MNPMTYFLQHSRTIPFHFLLLFFFHSFTSAQTSPKPLMLQDLYVMEGEWAGTLTYLDYQDNQTMVDIATRMVVTPKKRKIRYTYIYTEPSGKILKEKGVIQIIPEEEMVRMGNEQYSIQAFTVSEARNSGSMILTRTGVDSGNPCTIKRIIQWAPNSLEISTEILPDGEVAYFQRNRYSFSK